jgi:hypothetical protein
MQFRAVMTHLVRAVAKGDGDSCGALYHIRNDILNCYQKCIITGAFWKRISDVSHIMPFKLVDSSVKTVPFRFFINKFFFSWDKYEKSIDPEIWIIHLSKEALGNCDEYKKYHLTKISDNIIALLEENAEIALSTDC